MERHCRGCERVAALTFTVPGAMVTANRWQRMHYRVRGKYAASLGQVVAGLTEGRRPTEPLAYARVDIARYSRGTPDYDGLVGGCKALLDVLQPASKRHPHGLGIIADDSMKHIITRYTAHPLGGGVARTVVVVTELSRDVFEAARHSGESEGARLCG